MKEWKVVPIEPTPHMFSRGILISLDAPDVYKAMLSAAPTPPEIQPIAKVNSVRNSIGQGTIEIAEGAMLNPGDLLYTHPAPPSELVKAAEKLTKFIRAGMDLYASDDRANFGRLVENLAATLDNAKTPR